MNAAPFSIRSDLDLGGRLAAYLGGEAPDVELREGAVPRTLESPVQTGTAHQVAPERFLLHVPDGPSYLVQAGERITYARGGASDRTVALFLLGAPWGALCYQRGLLPLHASAVIDGERVHAFSGASGAGKSTIAAALASERLPFFSDELLVLEPSPGGSGLPTCYAGQSGLKLWHDAVGAVGAEQLHSVRDEPDFARFEARPAAQAERPCGKLASVFVLATGAGSVGAGPVRVEPVRGAAALKQLREIVYRPHLAHAIWGLPKLYAALARTLASVPVHRFERPWDMARLAEGAAVIRRTITEDRRDVR